MSLGGKGQSHDAGDKGADFCDGTPLLPGCPSIFQCGIGVSRPVGKECASIGHLFHMKLLINPFSGSVVLA